MSSKLSFYGWYIRDVCFFCKKGVSVFVGVRCVIYFKMVVGSFVHFVEIASFFGRSVGQFSGSGLLMLFVHTVSHPKSPELLGLQHL